MSGPLFIWSQKALAGETLEVFQDGQQSRDYIAVADVVKAIVLTLKQRRMEGIFNVGGDRRIKLIQLASWIKEAAHSHSQIQVKGGQPSVVDPYELFSSTSKIREFGWKPVSSIKSTIKKIF